MRGLEGDALTVYEEALVEARKEGYEPGPFGVASILAHVVSRLRIEMAKCRHPRGHGTPGAS